MDEKKINSNADVDWAKHYDYYEVNFRNNYNTISKPQNDSHFAMIKRHLGKYLNKNLNFAEIGFGSGITLRYASKYFEKVYGLDISPKNVEYTNNELKNEGFKNIECITFDMMKLNENFKNKFDVISFVHGLEHFSESDYPELFKNIKYYLKENGVFTGALPNNLDFNYRMCPNCNHVFEIDGHLSKQNKLKLSNLFIKNGFEIVHLDNFNSTYYFKYKGIIKTIYYLIIRNLFNKPANMQIEYIVKPS